MSASLPDTDACVCIMSSSVLEDTRTPTFYNSGTPGKQNAL
jgi:hypothetical protein